MTLLRARAWCLCLSACVHVCAAAQRRGHPTPFRARACARAPQPRGGYGGRERRAAAHAPPARPPAALPPAAFFGERCFPRPRTPPPPPRKTPTSHVVLRACARTAHLCCARPLCFPIRPPPERERKKKSCFPPSPRSAPKKNKKQKFFLSAARGAPSSIITHTHARTPLRSVTNQLSVLRFPLTHKLPLPPSRRPRPSLPPLCSPAPPLLARSSSPPPHPPPHPPTL
jgi:hypothetical protein